MKRKSDDLENINWPQKDACYSRALILYVPVIGVFLVCCAVL